MPYSANDVSGLPANVRGLSAKSRRRWVDVWNSVYTKCLNSAEPESGGCETSAFRQANGVIKVQHSAPTYATIMLGALQMMHNDSTELEQNKTDNKRGLSDEARKQLPDQLNSATHEYDETIAHDVAYFDLGPDPDNTTLIRSDDESTVVERRGLLFRSGEYPDKDFSLSPKELKKVAKRFGDPILIDSEHERSIFDGKLGRLVSVEANEDGTELHGVVAIPKWLDPILMGAGGKVSAAFDRATKALVGLALTINPRVTDAALMAAFSVDQAARGGLEVKELIRMADKTDKKAAKKAAKASAKAAKPDDDDDDDAPDDAPPAKKGGKFAGYDSMIPNAGAAGQSAHSQAKMAMTLSGRGMMQAIHDTTASRGAVCHVEPQPATDIGPYGIVRYASKPEMDVVQSIHDTTLQNGASCTPSLYGQQDVPGGLPWSWQWPGVASEGRSTVPGDTKAPHFTEEEKGSDKAMKAFAKFMESLDEVDPRYGKSANGKEAATMSATARPSNGHPKAVTEDSDSRRLDEENAVLREENRQMRMQGILDRAIAFADKMVFEGHATPIEREGIVTVHAQAEHDDTWTAKATFSNGMSRVSVYEASILARPNNLLAAELLPAAVQQGLIKFANMSETPRSGVDAGGKVTEDRKRYLASLDPVLKNHYAAMDAGTNGTARNGNQANGRG